MERDNQSAVNLSFNPSQLTSADEIVNDILAPPTGGARFREFIPHPGPSMSSVTGDQEKATTVSGFAYSPRPTGLTYSSGAPDKKALDRSYSPWTSRSTIQDEERLAQRLLSPARFEIPRAITSQVPSEFTIHSSRGNNEDFDFKLSRVSTIITHLLSYIMIYFS